MAESTSCCFSIFYKSTTLCWYWVHTNKSRPFIVSEVYSYSASKKYSQRFTFSTFDHVTALFQNRLNSLFFTKFHKQYPIMTTWRSLLGYCCRIEENNKSVHNMWKSEALLILSGWIVPLSKYGIFKLFPMQAIALVPHCPVKRALAPLCTSDWICV